MHVAGTTPVCCPWPPTLRVECDHLLPSVYHEEETELPAASLGVGHQQDGAMHCPLIVLCVSIPYSAEIWSPLERTAVRPRAVAAQ
eukprot:4148506-Prymnesium_polylepis.2